MAWSEIANIRGPQGEAAPDGVISDLEARFGGLRFQVLPTPPPAGTPSTVITIVPATE